MLYTAHVLPAPHASASPFAGQSHHPLACKHSFALSYFISRFSSVSATATAAGPAVTNKLAGSEVAVSLPARAPLAAGAWRLGGSWQS